MAEMKMEENGNRGAALELSRLNATPEEQWRHLRDFLDLNRADLDAMAGTVEILMRHATEFVVSAYDYLLHFKQTAEILGWEQGADPAHLAERRRFFTIWLARVLGLDLSDDPAHLAERRRFFTIWLARVLGLDLSDDLAHYLFRAGKYHAGHGPRHIHVPEIYVTGAISLAQASFASYLASEMTDAALVAHALTGWNKLLTMHLHLMTAGYRAARALDEGDFSVEVALFGRLRDLTGRRKVTVRLAESERAEHVLRKFFDYFPEVRAEVFDVGWDDDYRLDDRGTPWLTTRRVYRARRDWNIRLNGRNIEYAGGLTAPISPGDEVSVFPPGR